MRYYVLFLMTLTQTGASLLPQAFGSLVPFLVMSLALNKAQIGFAFGMVTVGLIAGSVLAGIMVDRFGERPIILWSGLAMGIALGAAATWENYDWLLFCFLIFSFANAASTPAGGRAILLWFRADRGFAMGIRQTGVPLGGLAGALTLPAIALHWDYRVALAAAGAFTVVLSLAAVFGYPDPPTQEVGATPFRELWRGMRRLARDPRSVSVSIVHMIFNVAQGAMISFFTLTLVNRSHVGVGAAALALAVAQAGATLGRVGWGLASDKLFGGDRMLPAVYASIISTVVELGLAFGYLHHPLVMYVTAFVLGLSVSGCMGLFAAAQTEIGGPQYAGSALGIAVARASAATFVSAPLFGLLADARGLPVAWVATAAISLLGVVPALVSRRLLYHRTRAEAA